MIGRLTGTVAEEEADGTFVLEVGGVGYEVLAPLGALGRAKGHATPGGELTFYVEDDDGAIRRRVAGAGETVAIAGRREHTIRNESGAEAVAFVVYAPGAGMEAFVRAAADLAAEGQPAIERVLGVAAEHGIEITRPLAEVA